MPRKKERIIWENKGKLNSVSPTTKAGIDEKEKGLYLMQIGFLNEQLERFQIKCEELEKQNKILISQYSSLETDKRDVTEYLKRCLSEKDEELDELQERLEGERQAAVREKSSLQLERGHLSQELHSRIDRLEEKNAALAETLSDLEEFQSQKDELKTIMENLEKRLECQEEEHKVEIHSLEMKALLEKRRFEEELESEVAAMSANVQRLVDQKLPETIRSVLKENAELKTRLGQLSDVARSLQEENTALRERKRELSVDTDILEQMVRETSRISCIRKKEVQQLTGKFQQLQEDDKEKQQRLEQLQTEHTRVLADMEALRLDRASLSAEWTRNRLERNQLEVKLKEERKRWRRMKSIMQGAADTLRQALKEAPTEQQDVDSIPQWRRWLQNLQEVLDGQTLSCSSAETGGELQESDQTTKRAESFQFQPSRRESHDSSLVSRPTQKPRDSLCRTGAGSCSSLVPLHRKPTIHKSSGNFSHSSVGFLTSKQSFTKSNEQNFLQIHPKNKRKDFLIIEKYF